MRNEPAHQHGQLQRQSLETAIAWHVQQDQDSTTASKFLQCIQEVMMEEHTWRVASAGKGVSRPSKLEAAAASVGFLWCVTAMVGTCCIASLLLLTSS